MKFIATVCPRYNQTSPAFRHACCTNPNESGEPAVPQIKDKVSSFFNWARKDKAPVSVDVTRRDNADEPDEATKKEVTIQQLKQGYGEVVETMQSLRTHLDQQSQRSEQMLELLRDLPTAIRSIPESNRTQTSMLEAIHENLDRQNQTTHQLTEAITGLATASAHQQRSLAAIDTHLAEEHESRGRLGEGVATLNDTLGQVTASNAATRESMGAVVEQTRVNDERMRNMYQRSQKMNTMMVLLCLALATGALALGGYMAVLVSRVVQPGTLQPAAASPVPVSPSASSAAGSAGFTDPGTTPPAPSATPDTSTAGFSSNAYITRPALEPPAETVTPIEPTQTDEAPIDPDLVGPPAPQN